jgi:hypothetical protein
MAMAMLTKASEMLQALEPRPVFDEEASRWDMAQLNLDRADSMQNPEQTSYFGSESIDIWNECIEWYGALDESQLEIIQGNPASFRIQRTLRQLGNCPYQKPSTS